MGLSEYERTVLRRLDADLTRQDPRLNRQLAEFTAQERDAGLTWRPPRVAVVVAAVMLAGVSFMLAAVTMLMRQPCRATPNGAQATTAAMAPSRTPESAGRHPGPPTRDPRDRSAQPGPTRPSPPTPC
ncbi:DUF3040 domain-containing protein [Actinomadura sp. 3N407]|uniref:DUF3040 domain-containing protein n=1 Tax=Actinomadura sp. 3N407 TaxID=3457423 RepID=UPI003FCED0AD